MPEPVLQTKLFMPPLRPQLVSRPRLLARLDAGRGAKLSLVSAPAGFGKTTLITHWLQQQKEPAAWLSLDENDNQPLRFFTYLVAALRRHDPTFAHNLAAALRSSSPPPAAEIVPLLLNELAERTEPFTLVLDDYHLIQNETVHDAVAYFVDFMPPPFHLIITSRVDPPLPLPRWRVRGQLVDIQAADLRFTAAETARFLQESMGLELDDTAVRHLESRTEGWVAALQLAALSLRQTDDAAAFITTFMGNDRTVGDYLLQEVLDRQPEPVQRFLLETAVLDRFNADLCAALRQEDDSRTIITTLERRNLFIIPLDNERRWYRYHHLFVEWLRFRLPQTHSAEHVAELRRRAAAWFRRAGLLEEAVAQARRIPDLEAVAHIINDVRLDYLFQDGGGLRIQRWIRELPPFLVAKYPYLAVLMSGASMLMGNSPQAYAYLQQFAAVESLQCYHDLFRSILLRNESGDHHEALRLARQTLSADPGGNEILAPMAWQQIAVNLFSLGDSEAADEAIMGMEDAIRGQDLPALNMRLHALEMRLHSANKQGALHQLQRLSRHGIRMAGGEGRSRTPVVGIMYAWLGHYHYQRNELAAAEAAIQPALDWAQRSAISDIYTYSASILAGLACLRGDREALHEALALYTRPVTAGRMKQAEADVAQLQAWFWLRMGDLETAVQWADSSGFTLADEPRFRDFDAYTTFLAIRLAQCRAAEDRTQLAPLFDLSERLRQHARQSHQFPALTTILTLQALILDFHNDSRAARTLQTALELARPGGWRRIFLDWGAPLAALLPRVARPGDAYAADLLNAFQEERFLPRRVETAVDLTPREQEILQLIAAGLANKEIQEKLVVSKNTVRTHIKNLYSKLMVKSRTQAIKKGRELDLIP